MSTMPAELGIQSADQVLVALEGTLRQALPQVLDLPEVKAYLGEAAVNYRPITTWQQLPTIQAIATADYPAVAITSPGLVQAPTYSRSSDSWETWWRAAVGIYDRAGVDDDGHRETQALVRNWIAFLRTAALRNQTLGGAARAVVWSGEDYDLLPDRNNARTIGAGALALDIKVQVPNTLGLGLPPVTSTSTQLDVN
jgi:hypothetical protein